MFVLLALHCQRLAHADEDVPDLSEFDFDVLKLLGSDWRIRDFLNNHLAVAFITQARNNKMSSKWTKKYLEGKDATCKISYFFSGNDTSSMIKHPGYRLLWDFLTPISFVSLHPELKYYKNDGPHGGQEWAERLFNFSTRVTLYYDMMLTSLGSNGTDTKMMHLANIMHALDPVDRHEELVTLILANGSRAVRNVTKTTAMRFLELNSGYTKTYLDQFLRTDNRTQYARLLKEGFKAFWYILLSRSEDPWDQAARDEALDDFDHLREIVGGPSTCNTTNETVFNAMCPHLVAEKLADVWDDVAGLMTLHEERDAILSKQVGAAMDELKKMHPVRCPRLRGTFYVVAYVVRKMVAVEAWGEDQFPNEELSLSPTVHMAIVAPLVADACSGFMTSAAAWRAARAATDTNMRLSVRQAEVLAASVGAFLPMDFIPIGAGRPRTSAAQTAAASSQPATKQSSQRRRALQTRWAWEIPDHQNDLQIKQSKRLSQFMEGQNAEAHIITGLDAGGNINSRVLSPDQYQTQLAATEKYWYTHPKIEPEPGIEIRDMKNLETESQLETLSSDAEGGNEKLNEISASNREVEANKRWGIAKGGGERWRSWKAAGKIMYAVGVLAMVVSIVLSVLSMLKAEAGNTRIGYL